MPTLECLLFLLVPQLSETFAGRKILLGVDRLDYIKGMPHKVSEAFVCCSSGQSELSSTNVLTNHILEGPWTSIMSLGEVGTTVFR